MGLVDVVKHACDTLQQRADIELVRTDAAKRIERPAEHVVATVVLPRALDGLDIARLFNDAHQTSVAPCVRAVLAHIGFRNIAADPAELHTLAHPTKRGLEPADVLRLRLHQVESDTLS